ncbi:MAG: hypothetical protein RL291_1084, partial [Pseudomonadota bacterium]
MAPVSLTQVALESAPQTAERLVPPRPPAPPAPLKPLRYFPTFVRNPLRSVPESVYHDPYLVPHTLNGRVAWVTEPSLVEKILLTTVEAFNKTPLERRILKPALGTGILTAEGQDWKWQRRTTAPLFQHKELTRHLPAMNDASQALIANWRETSSHAIRRVDRDMTDVTFDVLRRTIFPGLSEASTQSIKSDGDRYLNLSSWELAFGMIGASENLWHPAKALMRRAAGRQRALILDLVKRERAQGWPAGGILAKLGQATDPETAAPMDDEQIVDNLLTFAAAGHETTAKALQWALYLMARSPAWQARVRDEVRSVLGDGPVTQDNLDKLDITRRVLKESMRLYPPAPVMTRLARDGFDLGGATLRPGAIVVIPIFAMHRHSKLWTDPHAFDPDRFTLEREKTHART